MRTRGLTRLVAAVLAAGAVLVGAVGCATTPAPPVGVVQQPLPAVSADPALVALLPATLQGGTLRVAVPGVARPATGPEQELGEALAARLGLRALPDGMSATALPRALVGARHDVGILPVPVREAPLGGSVLPWLAARTAIVTPPGNPDRVEPTTLCGHRIGVVAGSAQHASVTEENLHCTDNRRPEIEIVPVGGAEDATRRLLADHLDAFVADAPAAGHAVVLGKGKLAIPGTPYGEGTAGMIVENRAAPAVRAALASLIADGTYAAILDRWLLGDLAVDGAALRT
ncbi:transporter substrate-binding domain-containing protein [Pseudonocardia sp. RS11V-5]|uniref:transporter substrate-binding domain-containing protein n=1 Tax=Pseudonocardia terrae TaxID=2905831 RepID=UPI001E3D96AB|nr:transporter substrate-binding domain-containing protein [Pseudonocardia terrae]MCE3556202.1 transporter substrate-binding domain-containing protein [Pseudonocardia terrae]